MKLYFGILLGFLSLGIYAQEDKVYQAIKLNIPKTGQEAQLIEFSKNDIIIENKKCFNYILKHNIDTEYGFAPNYFEISSLDSQVLFSGIIKQNMKTGNFEGTIHFPLIEKIGYENSKIIGRNDLMFNLLENSVIQKDCSVHKENLKLFYELSNEAEK